MGRFDSLTKLSQPVATRDTTLPLATSPHQFSPEIPGPAGRPGPDPAPALPPEHREIRPRHKFDIYEDQYEALRVLAETQRDKNGHPASMSAMVREALDLYLKARNRS